MKRIAVIGAGMAGLTLARQLDERAHVTVFEKSRGVSGRLATRRIGDYEFDHGAQFFTARSSAFQRFLAPYIREGLVAEWQPRVMTLAAGEKPYRRDWFEPHYVAVPRMNALCKHLAGDMDIQLETAVTGLEKSSAGSKPGWIVYTGETPWPESFDWVISTAPVVQTLALLNTHLSAMMLSGDTRLESASLLPCYSLMLGFKDPLALAFDAAKTKHLGIEWIMVNSSKQGRPESPTLVVQSSCEWAQQHLDDPDDQVINHMLAELDSVLDSPLPPPDVQSLQRWRYSRVEQALEPDYLLDVENGLGACGDWCMEGRVEGAFLSADRLARQLEQML